MYVVQDNFITIALYNGSKIRNVFSVSNLF